MDVCLIPAFRRPEFLWHCLANIKRADRANEIHYIFRLDHGFDPDCLKVIEGFPFSHEVTYTHRTRWRLAKQSYSLLTGYRLAAQKTERLVFMIEEDVMVATDFFRWHYAVQDLFELFCSIAVSNPNRHIIDIGGPEHFYLSSGDYCSLGVCFPKATLERFVLPHANDRYYIHPANYCKAAFGKTPIGEGYVEQDGLIRRAQMAVGASEAIAWPFTPRAYHAGLYGKNRGSYPHGPMAKRLAYVTDVIYSDEAMRKFAQHPAYYEDSKPINLNAEPWTHLTLKPLDSEINEMI